MPLSEILVAANVSPQHVDQLMNDGWTADHFALCASDMSEFDKVMAEIFEEPLNPLQKASLKLAWTRCQQASQPSPAEGSSAHDAAPVAPSGSWSETFAPKLTSTNVSQLKATFRKNYPAEILLPENSPSLRLLSMVVHQKSKSDFKWIPWKFRLSTAKSNEITAAKTTKMAKAEGLHLHAMLLDEPPAIEGSNGTMGMHGLRQMFETFSFAMAMAEVAHLSSLKGYYLKFLSMMTQRFDSDTGLRGPTILEAQAADKALMTTVIDLVVERDWSWDDALYEITHIRADMTSLLQPRPKLPKVSTPFRSDNFQGKGSSSGSRPGPYSKGQGKQGKSTGKSTRVQWLTEATVKGEKRQLCMRYQSPEHLQGLPDISSAQLLRVQESNLMHALHRRTVWADLSRETAEYPEQLATAFAQADWSASHRFSDCFQTLRKNFSNQILHLRLDQVLMRSFLERSDSPPFTMEQLTPFRAFIDEFLLAQGVVPNWTIPSDQNLSLFILQQLSSCMDDPDTALFPYLIEGVPLGIHEDIAPSKCFPLQVQQDDFYPPLLTVHHTNWSSAEDDPDTVKQLIDKEVAAGWVEVFPGDMAAAQQFFEHGIAVGKLGLALSDTRPPRLVLDSTICGVNPQSKVPEKATLPTARDVLRAYPLRQSNHHLSGVSFDVRSAHKQVAVHPKYRGYLCFQFQGTIYYYKNCPFGAVVSAHFWSRLGGIFQRLFHRMCYLPHASFLYVDDLLWLQETKILGLSASVIAILCLLVGLPISWKKCELGATIVWIGWSFNLSAGYVTLPDTKRVKLLELIRKLLSSSTCSKKTLERFLGLALWVTQLWPEMRIWLQYLYRDLHSIPASQYSVDPGNWEEVVHCLSDNLVFTSKPRYTAIPMNGHLIQVRHQPVHSVSDLRSCALSDKRIWLRVRDPQSSKRKLSQASHRILKSYLQWLDRLSPVRSMWPKPTWPGLCVADACASGQSSGIGGAIFFPSGKCSWFSLIISYADFNALQIPVHEDLQKDISSLETLAQIALVYIAMHSYPGARIPIRVPTLSDNTGAEAVSNRLFTTTMPLALFLEKLCVMISSSHMEVEISHIAGHDNVQADALSRWNGQGDPPCHFLMSDRFHLTLDSLWNLSRAPTLVPSDAWIPWQLPS
eukprot:s1968_g5.t1